MWFYPTHSKVPSVFLGKSISKLFESLSVTNSPTYTTLVTCGGSRSGMMIEYDSNLYLYISFCFRSHVSCLLVMSDSLLWEQHKLGWKLWEVLCEVFLVEVKCIKLVCRSKCPFCPKINSFMCFCYFSVCWNESGWWYEVRSSQSVAVIFWSDAHVTQRRINQLTHCSDIVTYVSTISPKKVLN